VDIGKIKISDDAVTQKAIHDELGSEIDSGIINVSGWSLERLRICLVFPSSLTESLIGLSVVAANEVYDRKDSVGIKIFESQILLFAADGALHYQARQDFIPFGPRFDPYFVAAAQRKISQGYQLEDFYGPVNLAGDMCSADSSVLAVLDEIATGKYNSDGYLIATGRMSASTGFGVANISKIAVYAKEKILARASAPLTKGGIKLEGLGDGITAAPISGGINKLDGTIIGMRYRVEVKQ